MDIIDYILKIIAILISIASLHISIQAFKFNKHQADLKRIKEEIDNEKDASLPPRSKKRPKPLK